MTFGESVPEDMNPLAFMQEQARSHAERHEAMSEVFGHELSRELRSMTSSQLEVLANLLHMMSSSDHPARLAAFYTGRIVSIREAKFGICPHCASSHDDPSELTKDGPADVKPPFDPELFQAPTTNPEEPSIWTKIGSTDILHPHELGLMNKFTLDDLREEGTGKLLGFICMGCEVRYVSIEDRIKAPPGPEGCSGCQQKAKWG